MQLPVCAFSVSLRLFDRNMHFLAVKQSMKQLIYGACSDTIKTDFIEKVESMKRRLRKRTWNRILTLRKK